MRFLAQSIDLFMHLDKYLSTVIQTYGTFTYAILFIVLFCETGLVITPFLPGDSLLFAAGTFAAQGAFEIKTLLVLLCLAPIIGDSTNYWIGRAVGPKVFHRENVRFLNKKHLERTHRFYEKHGGKTVIIARFMPIIRTFAPFVAGIGKMTYWRFLSYSIAGSILWIGLFVLGGFFFGNIPVVKANFTIAIFVIIFISILPGIIEYVRHRLRVNSRAPSP
ncbi:MAG: DedA family protein [Pseudomonadota bacterium]